MEIGTPVNAWEISSASAYVKRTLPPYLVASRCATLASVYCMGLQLTFDGPQNLAGSPFSI